MNSAQKTRLGLAFASALIGLILVSGVYAIPGLGAVASPSSPPVLDQAGTDVPGNTQVVTETIQISQPNALVFFYWPGAASATVPVTSFTSNPPLVWKNPPWVITSDGAGFNPTLMWYAAAPNPGTLTMTMTFASPINRFFKVFWFDYLGANTTSPFDPNPSLPAYACCPQGTTNTITGVSTTYPNDLLLAFIQETSGSLPNNIPTFNAPFSQVVTNINGGYSIAMAWASAPATSVVSGATYSPVTWTVSGLTRGIIFAIRGAASSGTTTTTNYGYVIQNVCNNIGGYVTTAQLSSLGVTNGVILGYCIIWSPTAPPGYSPNVQYQITIGTSTSTTTSTSSTTTTITSTSTSTSTTTTSVTSSTTSTTSKTTSTFSCTINCFPISGVSWSQIAGVLFLVGAAIVFPRKWDD